MLDNLSLDLLYAARSLARRPSLVVIATLTLGLGIGATTAIFSILDASLLRPLPFPESDRLAMLYLTRATDAGATSHLRWSYPKLQFFRQSATLFESVAGFTRADVNLNGSGDPERVVAEIVSQSYFPALRVEAALGRTFLPA